MMRSLSNFWFVFFSSFFLRGKNDFAEISENNFVGLNNYVGNSSMMSNAKKF